MSGTSGRSLGSFKQQKLFRIRKIKRISRGLFGLKIVQDKFMFKKIRLMFPSSVTENSRTLLQDAKLPWAKFKINTSKLSPNYDTLGMFYFIAQNKDTFTFSTSLFEP
jgi:hypothetical protein